MRTASRDVASPSCGLALGIDGAAHRGALAANGDTIAVLGSGVDLIQPASHRRLGERIVREGLLMSEFLPEEPARAHHFPRRNRILAALSGATVVVEAATRAGRSSPWSTLRTLGVTSMWSPVRSMRPRAAGATR